ncbi:hypothetical protein KI387_032664, partial [Taxus chinensis]
IFLSDEIVARDSPSAELFLQGPLHVEELEIRTRGLSSEKSLVLAVPIAAGKYPVVIFLHGYVPLRNKFYYDLLQQVASHGYIAVAPLLYDSTGWDATEEMIETAAIADWLPKGLHLHFPQHLKEVIPDFDRVAIAGHRRGGKVAFGVTLGLVSQTSLKFSAIAAFDPVDGTGDCQNPPPLLTYTNNSFHLKMPALIVGTGLGSKRSLLLPACAPERLGHEEFFIESPAPSYHFVAYDYGVNDILNSDLVWLSCLLCRCRIPSGPMRRFAAGVLVAFLRSAMGENGEALKDILENPGVAPVRLEPPQYKLVPDVPAPAPVPEPEAPPPEPELQMLLQSGIDDHLFNFAF